MHLFSLRYPVLWFTPKVPPHSKIIKEKMHLCFLLLFLCFNFFFSPAFRSLVHLELVRCSLFLTFTQEKTFLKLYLFIVNWNDFTVKKKKRILKYYITLNSLLAFFNVLICILHSCNLCTYSLTHCCFFGGSKGLALFLSPSPEDPTPWYLTHIHILLKQCFSNCMSHEINLVCHNQYFYKRGRLD